jgi:hypothetical protein
MTEGLHQESILCEANTCTLKVDTKRRKGEGNCQANSDLGSTGGL